MHSIFSGALNSNKKKMKKLKLVLFFLSITTVLLAQDAAPMQKIVLSPEHPNPGDEITITYNAANGPLANAMYVNGVVYTYDNFKWITNDVILKATGDKKWEAKMKLSDHASFINCVFKSDTIVDRGEKMPNAYMFAQVPGAYTGWGILRSRAFQNEVPNVVHDSAYIADQVGLMWINYELQYHPESRKKIFYYGLKLKQLSTGKDQSVAIKKELRGLLSENNLDNTTQYDIQKTLSLLENPADKVFTDSVQTVLVTKYPLGVLSRDRHINEIFKEADFSKKVKLYADFSKNFPQNKFEDVYTDLESLYYDKMIKSIVYGYIVNNKDYNYALNSVKSVSFTNLLDYHWHLVSIPFDRDHEGTEKASIETLKKYADIFMGEMEKRIT